MSEIDDYAEEIEEVLDKVEEILEKEVGKLRGQERIEKCSYLKARLARAKKIHRSIINEMRDLPAGAKPEWDQKAKAYDARIAKLTQDVEWAETSASRDDLKKKQVDDMTTKEITGTALQIQEQTQQSTARAKRMVEETLEMGIAIKEEVHVQGQQMAGIQENLEQIESNLKRAERQFRVFVRRMATDRIFIVFILLIVILIILAIVLVVLKNKGIINVSDSGTITIPDDAPSESAD